MNKSFAIIQMVVLAFVCSASISAAGSKPLASTYTSTDKIEPPSLEGRVLFEGRSKEPGKHLELPLMLVLSNGLKVYKYEMTTTDNGSFDVNTKEAAPGVYTYWVKSPKFLPNTGPVKISGSIDFEDMGVLRAGDANNDKSVDAKDVEILKATFLLKCDMKGYDDRADFNGDCLVDNVDYKLLLTNFGKANMPPSGAGIDGSGCSIMEGRVQFEGRSQEPGADNVLPLTLVLSNGKQKWEFDIPRTGIDGSFNIITEKLPPGYYKYWVKNAKFLSNTGPVKISGELDYVDLGMLRAGDANGDNVVNSLDASIVKAAYGTLCEMIGYDDRADFNDDCVVSETDYKLLLNNFGKNGGE